MLHQFSNGHGPGLFEFSNRRPLVAVSQIFPDKAIRIWDLEHGGLVGEFSWNQRSGLTARPRFSLDDTFLALRIGDAPVRQLAMDAAGERLATVGTRTDHYDSEIVHVWDVGTASKLYDLEHRDRVHVVRFSPDGSTLLTTAADRTARLWDVKTGKERTRFDHGADIVSARLSSDNMYLAVASDGAEAAGKNIHVWHASDKREIAQLPRLRDEAFEFQPGAKRLAVADDSGNVRIWELESARVEKMRLTHDAAVFEATPSPNGLLVATRQYSGKQGRDLNYATIWDLRTGKELRRAAHEDSLYDLEISRNGRLLATVGADKVAKLWNLPDLELVREIVHENKVHKVTFDSQGEWLATYMGGMITGRNDSSEVGELKVWRLKHTEDAAIVARGLIQDFAFSPSGAFIATAEGETEDGTSRSLGWIGVRVFDLSSGREIRRIEHDNPIRRVSFIDACSRVDRGLTDEQWRLYLGDVDYSPVCQNPAS